MLFFYILCHHLLSIVANQLFKDVRVLCWVMTCPSAHQQKAVHILRTWGKRCNKLLFMSTENGWFWLLVQCCILLFEHY